MTVVTLDVTSSGLEQSAAAIISVGKADFTVAKRASRTRWPARSTKAAGRIQPTPGVASVVGVLVETQHLNADNPVFIEIGINPGDLPPSASNVWPDGLTRPRGNQVMLGWRAAANFGLRVGDRFHANGTTNTVVGIYSTGNSFGDAGAMFPLPAVQGYNRVPGIVTLAFVKVTPGASVAAVAAPRRLRPAGADDYPHRHRVREGRPEPCVPPGGRQREHRARHPDRRRHRRQHHASFVLRADSRVRPAAGHRMDSAPDGSPPPR